MNVNSQRPRPHLLVVGTGGTIAGLSAAAQGTHYAAGVVPVETLLDAVPGVGERVDLLPEHLFSLDSVELTTGHRMHLARHLADRLGGSENVDGIVVTHGTDSMEETAYLLHLALPGDVPVVLTGAMRPADDPGADGPANLADAVAVASSPEAHGLGTVVVMSGQVHGAREVSKRHATSVDAFASGHGPLGHVARGRFELHHRPARRFGTRSSFTLTELPETLPAVEVVTPHSDSPPDVLRPIVESGVAGMVYAGPGAGNASRHVAAILDDARSAGVAVVRASRAGAGAVARGGAVDDDAHDWVAAGDLPPFKARVLLALALTRTTETSEIQMLFDTH